MRSFDNSLTILKNIAPRKINGSQRFWLCRLLNTTVRAVCSFVKRRKRGERFVAIWLDCETRIPYKRLRRKTTCRNVTLLLVFRISKLWHALTSIRRRNIIYIYIYIYTCVVMHVCRTTIIIYSPCIHACAIFLFFLDANETRDYVFVTAICGIWNYTRRYIIGVIELTYCWRSRWRWTGIYVVRRAGRWKERRFSFS